jgi:hypothetical protein
MTPIRPIQMAAWLAVASALVTAPGDARAQDVEYRPWSELVIVVGHKVALSLPDGYVEGRALGVTGDALEVDVEKTSNGDAYSKGPVNIPRARVSVIRLRRSDGRAPRVASQIVGQAAVMGGFFGGLNPRGGIRSSLRGAGIQIGAAAAGAAIGRRLDDRDAETLIRVAPEPAASATGESRDRRPTCLAEPDQPNQSIDRVRINALRTGDGSRTHVDEHDSGDRRTAGQPVPRCGNR